MPPSPAPLCGSELALRGWSLASALEWGPEKVADRDGGETNQAAPRGQRVGGELEVFPWAWGHVRCECVHAHNCSAFSSLFYHAEWRRGVPRLKSLWGQARNFMGQIFSLTGMSIKLGEGIVSTAICTCSHALFSVTSIIPTRVRCPGPRVSMGNGREQTRAPGKVQSLKCNCLDEQLAQERPFSYSEGSRGVP